MWKKSMAWILSLALLVGSIGTFAFFSLAEDVEETRYTVKNAVWTPAKDTDTQNPHYGTIELVDYKDGAQTYARELPNNNKGIAIGFDKNNNVLADVSNVTIEFEYFLPEEETTGGKRAFFLNYSGHNGSVTYTVNEGKLTVGSWTAVKLEATDANFSAHTIWNWADIRLMYFTNGSTMPAYVRSLRAYATDAPEKEMSIQFNLKTVDKSELQAAVDGAKTEAELAGFTKASADAYKAALEAAKTVLGNSAATEQDVADALAALNKATAELEVFVVKNVAKVDLLDPANNVNATITKNDLTKKVTVAGKEANWYGTAHNDRPIEFTFDTSVFPNVDENPDVDGVQSNLTLKIEYYLPSETAAAISEANEGLTVADSAKSTLAFRRPHWNSIDNKVDGGTGKEPALNLSIGGAGAAFTPVVYDQWAVAYVPMDNTMLANGNYFHVCFYNGNAEKTVGYFLRSLTLVKEADKTELVAAVENAKEDLSGYTEETAAAYAEALAAAKAVLAKDGATEEDVATALKNLQDADAALEETVAPDYSSAEVDYSTGEVVLKNMTVGGNHIPGGENVTTPVEIGGSNGLKLQNTNANMCLKIDPNVLAENDSNVTIRVEYYLPEESTDGSQMRPYYFSVEDAKKYGDWKKASDATLVKGEWATAEWQLTDAKFLRKAENGNGQMDGGSDLMLIFNTNTPGDCIYIRKITVTKTAAPDPKDALREMVAAEIKDLSAYTADSAKTYTDAMNAAKAVLDNEEATEADIQKAIDDLNAAIKGLTAAKAPEVIVLETMDNATDFNSGTLDTTNKKQGAGAIFATSEGGKEALIARKNATLDIALPQGWADTYYLEAWFYVSDVDALPGSSWIEISQQQDQIEAQFNLGTLTGLQDGWNKIQIKIRDMSLSKIEQMEKVAQLRFFCTPTDALTVGFDDIVLTPYAGAANDSDYGKQQVADLAEAVAKAEKVDTKDVPKALTDALDAAIAAAKAVNGEEATVRDVMVLAETLAAAQKAVEDYEAPTQPTTEPSATETEPSVTETEPSETETEPSVTETEPSETETEPSATETEPSETEPEPSEPEETEPSNEEPGETAAPTTEALPGQTETGEASAVLPVALLAVAAAAVSAVVLKKKEQK